ncbi:MAG: PepSY domain-containing protein [Betaproteobacteria bacterium]|nr:PepSY domain-containing protein [Betaproteobacteria bacterium]
MRTPTALTTFVLSAALVAGGIFSPPAFAQDNRPATVVERQWLSIPQVHDKLEAAGYRHIEKIERERGSYEVRASDPSGQRVKLYVNPTTGKISDRSVESRRRHRGDGVTANDRRYRSADCNERRCRDDLPQAAPASPPKAR